MSTLSSRILTSADSCRLNGAEPDRATWKKAFELYTHAFRAPPTERDKKRLARILKKPVDPKLADTLFTYDAFLLGLGRMSLSTSPVPPSHTHSLTDAVQTWRRTVGCTCCTRT